MLLLLMPAEEDRLHDPHVPVMQVGVQGAEQGGPRPLIQLLELVRFVAGGLGIQQLAHQPLPERVIMLVHALGCDRRRKVGHVLARRHRHPVPVINEKLIINNRTNSLLNYFLV